MERLVQENINSPQEYDSIFLQRKEKGVDKFDLKRWELLLKYFKGGRLIDLGCLDSLIPAMAKKDFPKSEVWGIDVSKEALSQMQVQHPEVYYEPMDVYKTSFPSGYFSYAVAGELIEHLENPKEFIEEAFRILKTDGILALSTPLEEKKGEVDAHRHLWSFKIQDIRDLLSPYGNVKFNIFPKFHIPLTTYHHKNIIAWTTKL